MTSVSKPTTLLMADDDPDDRFLLQEAISEITSTIDFLYFVEDGEELMDYLHRRGKYSDPQTAPEPALILLDLNMPRKNGYEAITELKTNPHFRKIPVVILTTSQSPQDIIETYQIGANSYITKPSNFEQLITIVDVMLNYWFNVVKLPY